MVRVSLQVPYTPKAILVTKKKFNNDVSSALTKKLKKDIKRNQRKKFI
jgi:hypothetical protein